MGCIGTLYNVRDMIEVFVKDLYDLDIEICFQLPPFPFSVENQDVTHFHELTNAMMLSLIIYIMNW